MVRHESHKVGLKTIRMRSKECGTEAMKMILLIQWQPICKCRVSRIDPVLVRFESYIREGANDSCDEVLTE